MNFLGRSSNFRLHQHLMPLHSGGSRGSELRYEADCKQTTTSNTTTKSTSIIRPSRSILPPLPHLPTAPLHSMAYRPSQKDLPQQLLPRSNHILPFSYKRDPPPHLSQYAMHRRKQSLLAWSTPLLLLLPGQSQASMDLPGVGVVSTDSKVAKNVLESRGGGGKMYCSVRVSAVLSSPALALHQVLIPAYLPTAFGTHREYPLRLRNHRGPQHRPLPRHVHLSGIRFLQALQGGLV